MLKKLCLFYVVAAVTCLASDPNTGKSELLDLSNSDLGPDMLPLAENLVWLQSKPSDGKEQMPNATVSDHKKTTTRSSDDPIHTDATSSTNATDTKPSGTQARPPQMTGCRTQGQIAVTYSEGPSDATAKIVRNLNNADARANFFFNASWLYTQQYAMVVQNIYQAGHFVGMTYRVKNDNSSFWTDNEIREDILGHARTIETLINVSPKYVRLHYTPEPDLRVENILHDLGFVLVGYNLDSQDYSHKEATGPNSIQDVYRQTFYHQKDTYDAKGSFVSIQYDIPDTGALVAVPFMIDAINDGGYTMVRLDGCLNDPTPYKKSADSKEYVADRFSFNGTDYHQGQKAIAPEALVVEPKEDDVCFYILFNYVAPSLPVSWLANLVSPRYRPNYMFSAKEGVTCENRPRLSGELTLPETNDHYFFLFYPAHNEASKQSTILWLNGGPGCSSLMGAMAGIGPCHITPDGNNTVPNPFTWNENFSLLFLDQVKEIDPEQTEDQPIGTGFSHGDSKPATSLEAAKQIHLFLESFFGIYRKYVPTSLIIAGESYAGRYLPALSDEILRQNRLIDKGRRRNGIRFPLKAILIGNGWTDPKTQLAHYHTFGCDNDNEYKPLFGKDQCTKMEAASSRCQALMVSCYSYPSRWACIPAGLYCQHTLLAPYQHPDPMDIRLRCPHQKYYYATEQGLETYANNPDVRRSLGVDEQAPRFENCRSAIERRFLLTMDPLLDYSHAIARALHQEIAVLVYAVDTKRGYGLDMRGNKAWTMALDWNGKEGFNTAPDEDVYTDGSVKAAGQMRSYGKLSFLKVFDAGHMAISDQPSVGQDFILKQWLHSQI